MRDHAIAPTAQRLAEENNVDWRVLEGSGEGGSVVERDVLGYLARVMSGEEATNPTPEPLPEGLSAWPEEPERRRNTQGQSTRSQSTRSQSAPPSRNAPKTTPERADHRSANRSAKETDPGITPFTVPARSLSPNQLRKLNRTHPGQSKNQPGLPLKTLLKQQTRQLLLVPLPAMWRLVSMT